MSDTTENGRLEKLIELASSPAPKNVHGLAEIVRAQSLVLIDIHLEIKKKARADEEAKESTLQIVLTRVVAPLVVGTLMWLLFNFGPRLLVLTYPTP